jgi:hypothetical protein
MIGVYREFESCMRLMGHVLRRLRVLALPPVTVADRTRQHQPAPGAQDSRAGH